MLNLFKTNKFENIPSIGFLLFRMTLGSALMIHGWTKIQAPMTWMGDSVPAIFQFLAAIAEFGGGLSWIIGLAVPISSFGIFCAMAVAVHMHAVIRGDPFVGKESSYEPALIYLVSSLLLFLAGPGKFSLDQKIFGSKSSKNI